MNPEGHNSQNGGKLNYLTRYDFYIHSSYVEEYIYIKNFLTVPNKRTMFII